MHSCADGFSKYHQRCILDFKAKFKTTKETTQGAPATTRYMALQKCCHGHTFCQYLTGTTVTGSDPNLLEPIMRVFPGFPQNALGGSSAHCSNPALPSTKGFDKRPWLWIRINIYPFFRQKTIRLTALYLVIRFSRKYLFISSTIQTRRR